MNPTKKLALVTALVGASIAGGAVGAGVIGTAGAQTSDPAATATAPDQHQAQHQARPDMPAPGSPEHEAAEQPVTGDAAAKAQAAAVASESGSTAGDVTTDFTGDGYEVQLTKADGTTVEVHLDGNFTVMQHGGPGGHGAPGGPGGHGLAAPDTQAQQGAATGA